MSLLHLIHFKQIGYFGIYMSLALGVLGVPIPDEALMTYLGFAVHMGKLSYYNTLFVSFLGSITGMSLSYLIGRGILTKFEGKLEKRFNLKDKRLKFESLFVKYGNIIIIVGYFFPGIRHLTAYSCGFLKMSYIKFLLYAAIGAFIWVNTFLVLGSYLGNDWRYILYYTVRYKNIIAVIVILILSVFLYFFLGRRREEKES